MANESLDVMEEDPRPGDWPGAVLPAEAIQYYSTETERPLIHPFDRDLLGAARYELRLGAEANVGGKPHTIDDQHPMVLPPHQVAVVKTYEYLRVPRFVIGRWNLRVSMVYEGLLWVGGPQVDPGWAGYLYCPIYNLAEREVYLKYKQPIFTIDFVRVYPTQFPDKRFTARRRSLDEHDIHRLKSAPFEELNRLLRLEPRFYGAFGIIIALLVLIIGVIGVIVSAPIVDNLAKMDNTLLPLVFVAMGLGIFSLILSGIILWKARPRPIWGTFRKRPR